MTTVVLDVKRAALRLRVGGRSTARGSLPAAPALFAQQALFAPIDSSDSAFGVMEQTLRAAVDGRSNSSDV